MPLALQAKLLRALQEREFEPLGSNTVVRFDARVIAASSIDLGQLVEQGRFRADLYYRLNVLPIRLPPLRERPEDLEPLCEHLLELIALDNEMQPKEIDREAIDALARLPWKGNVRELRNVLERAVLLCRADQIGPGDLRFESGPSTATAAPTPPTDGAAITPQPGAESLTLQEVERRHIEAVLRAENGHVGRAATRLGIPRSSLYQKIAKLGLSVPKG
jgi:DNA-binding NtrC family response regulator